MKYTSVTTKTFVHNRSIISKSEKYAISEGVAHKFPQGNLL